MSIQNDILIAYKYKILQRIDNGTFGNIYKGVNTKTQEYIAIKIEDKQTQYKLLKREASILKYLHEHQCRNIPSIYWFGQFQNNMGLVIPFYDCSLYQYCKIKSLNESQLQNIMVQCISILESIHNNMIIHRDIKPHNIMIKQGNLYLIDFGIATFYINEENIHQPNVIGEQITGTPKYISYNIHNGCTPSRRDDLISLGYVYIYLCAQELPWDNILTNNNNELYPNELYISHSNNLLRKSFKQIENIIKICKNINTQLEYFFIFCDKYDYHETPNYLSLYNLFTQNNNS